MSLVVMKDHGDVHAWDLTKAQARLIIKVGLQTRTRELSDNQPYRCTT